MFVSSYSTYITPTLTQSNKSQKLDDSRYQSASKVNEKTLSQEESSQKKLPINFISDYKVLNNQQKLNEQTQQFEKSKFTKINVLNSAKTAYQEGATRFSFTQKPKVSLGDGGSRLPQPTTAKLNAVNTYLANDNYYKVTA
ncbi:hypothetical protein [Sulfurimonas sp.]